MSVVSCPLLNHSVAVGSPAMADAAHDLRLAMLAAAHFAAVDAGFVGLVVAEVAAGERDEDVLQADVPGGQAGQRPSLAIELVEQGGDRAMRLGDGQRVAVALGPGGEDRVEAEERFGVERAPSPAASRANSTMWSPPSRAISSAGDPMAMILPWSMIATRSQSRSASSM